MTASTVLTILGLLFSLTTVYRFVDFLLVFLRPSQLHRYLHPSADGQKPAWALVTGASDGIGKQLARELARAGFNVVLHGRNPTKLAGVQDELTQEFPAPREFRCLVADAGAIACIHCQQSSSASHTPPAVVDFDAIAASLADIHLTVLINNAGGNPFRPVYQYAYDKPLAQYVATVNLNAVFPLVLLSKLLPQLLGATPALVINVGSIADIGTPGLNAYAPCKAFLNAATVGLARELLMQQTSARLQRAQRGPSLTAATVGRGEGAAGLEMLGVRVGEVCGTAHDKGVPTLFHPTASTMAKAVLARVGCGRRLVVGYLPHALQGWMTSALPEGIVDQAVLGSIRPRWELDAKKD